MTYPSEVTDLIQRYLWRVERRLPAPQAADVVAELDSLLRDQLDARSETLGRPVDEDLVCEVLKAFGSPEETAARYNASPRYLIGPAAYPVFLKVAGWVLGGMTLVVLLQTILRAISEHALHLGWLFLSAFGALYQSLFFSLGWLVIIFAVIERTQFKGWPPKLDWDPRDLPELPPREEDKATQASAALELIGPILLLWILNYSPNWAGLVTVSGAQVHVLRFSELGFQLPMPWINGCLVMGILLNLAVLNAGRWNAGLRWAQVFLGFLGAGIVAWIFLHAVQPTPQAVEALAMRAGFPTQVLGGILQGVYSIGRLLPLLMLIAPLKRIYRLLGGVHRIARKLG